jgi:hypothetical protein
MPPIPQGIRRILRGLQARGSSLRAAIPKPIRERMRWLLRQPPRLLRQLRPAPR